MIRSDGTISWSDYGQASKQETGVLIKHHGSELTISKYSYDYDYWEIIGIYENHSFIKKIKRVNNPKIQSEILDVVKEFQKWVDDYHNLKMKEKKEISDIIDIVRSGIGNTNSDNDTIHLAH